MTRKSLFFTGRRFLFGRYAKNTEQDLARKAVRGAILSIAISLVPLITVMQVADGMIQGITSRYMELGTYHMQILSYPGSSLLDSELEEIRSQAGITGVWKETRSVGAVFTKGTQEGVMIRAVENGYLYDPGTLKYIQVVDGSLELTRPMDALIGSALAKQLNLRVGDPINLITMNQDYEGRNMPKISIFIIRGIVSAGYRKIDAQWLMISESSSGRVLFPSSSQHLVGVKVGNPYKGIDASVADLALSLRPGFRVFSWKELEKNNFASLASTRTMLLLIMALTVGIASVNVVSALSTLAMERAQEIAILKCMGAGPGDMILLFSLSGAVLGALGAILGSLGGMLASMHINEIIVVIEKLINAARSLFDFRNFSHGRFMILDPAFYLERIPVSIQFGEIAMIILVTTVLSMCSALLPAWRSAKLLPLDIFRRH